MKGGVLERRDQACILAPNVASLKGGQVTLAVRNGADD